MITPEDQKATKKALAKITFSLSDSQIAKLLETGAYQEIDCDD